MHVTNPVNVITLIEAFNLVGRRTSGSEWNEQEAAAIRLGQRGQADKNTRRRGLEALATFRRLASHGVIDLIYTDEMGRRVPYFRSVGPWLIAIYPDPIGTGEGMIELDDQHIHPCVVDARGLKGWRPATEPKARTGPERKYAPFQSAIIEFFRTCSVNFPNGAAWEFARDALKPDDLWPSSTWGNALINRARDERRSRER